MPSVYKVLGQVSPSATTATTLYTTPAATGTVASTLVICNRDTTPGTFRVAVRPAGAALANQHYICYDITIPANETIRLTIGITLAATDVVTVYSSTANMSFSLFGTEVT